MKETKIISINPGVKTLGELHNPTPLARLKNVAEVLLPENNVAPTWFDFFYGVHDNSRPAYATLFMRILAASTTLWCASLLPAGIMSVAMMVLAIMLAGGLFTRIASIAEVALFGMLLLTASSSSSFHVILTVSSIAIALCTLLIITGGGRLSLDSVIARKITK